MSVPVLDELAGPWMSREELAHLPSLRNQWGQAHVNADLASLSWLAIPPYSGGYHTGALRVNGHVLAAQRFRWFPWGVQRAANVGDLRVTTDVRMGYQDTSVHWRTTVTNLGSRRFQSTLEQELLAPIAHSEVDWGWLYGTPWNAGHYHDHYTTERIRSEVIGDEPRQVQFLTPGARHLRLGSPRIPGIQRDEERAPMLLESELPDHSTSDSGRSRPPAARATVRLFGDEYRLDRDDIEYRLDAVALTSVVLEVRTEGNGSGVLLTHGNHPDSLQLGLADGRPWMRAGGEQVAAEEALEAGEWATLEVHIGQQGAVLSVNGREAGRTRVWWEDQRWRASEQDGALVVTDSLSPAQSTYTFVTPPDKLVAGGARGHAVWQLSLAPGSTVELGTTLAIGAGAPPMPFEEIAQRWRETWVAAFTPGNSEFSGHLPTLETADKGLARTYYLGALLAIYMRNTGVSPIGPVFLTGGPRLGPTITFYWDQSEWAHTAALLEPVGIRAWILAALAQPYDRSHSFDTRNLLPVGNHYAANDHALFRTVRAYLSVTGDRGLLQETVGGQTVLDHLRSMANRGAHGLADFGDDAWELLECVPNYRHAVASFNAGYVGMLRHLAEMLGETEEAAAARTRADELAKAVLGLYAGGGRWRIASPGGEETIGHVLDFILVAADMAEDLSDQQRAEMIDFVTTRLIDGNWMRALSSDDPMARFSDRPDHGAAGAFAAWPGATAYGLCRLGRPDLAQQLLSRIHASTSGGLWGQAMETVGRGRYRVAERGVANRDSSAAVAATEAVICGLFGGGPTTSAAGRLTS